MPPKDKPLKAPLLNASKDDHKKHADEFLKLEKHKVKPAELNDTTDEAKP